MRLLRTLSIPILTGVLALVSGAILGATQARSGKGVLRYAISYSPLLDGGSFRIEFTFIGEESGRTRVILPSEWGGQDQLYLGIRALRVDTAEATLTDTEDPAVKLIMHNPGAELRVTYTVVRDRNGRSTGGGRFYRPILMPDYFFVIGQALWVYPGFDLDVPRKVELNWSGLPNLWKSSNSFGIGQNRQSLTISIDQLRRGVYMSGDFRVITRRVHGRPVYFATRGLWRFGDEAFVDVCTRIITAGREFFDDYDFPFFLVTLLPTDDSPGNALGEARAQGFSLFTSSQQTDLNGLFSLLAHEMFHLWNPGRIGGLGNDERLYWFSEGFTDYFASIILSTNRTTHGRRARELDQPYSGGLHRVPCAKPYCGRHDYQTPYQWRGGTSAIPARGDFGVKLEFAT